MGRGALGGAALSPRALLPERQQPSQVRQNLKMLLLPFVMDIMLPVWVVVVVVVMVVVNVNVVNVMLLILLFLSFSAATAQHPE